MQDQKWKTLFPGCALRFPYENYRGETEIRDVEFLGVDYGSNEWYPEPQWFLRCFDLSRKAHRSFAINKIDPATLEIL